MWQSRTGSCKKIIYRIPNWISHQLTCISRSCPFFSRRKASYLCCSNPRDITELVPDVSLILRRAYKNHELTGWHHFYAGEAYSRLVINHELHPAPTTWNSQKERDKTIKISRSMKVTINHWNVEYECGTMGKTHLNLSMLHCTRLKISVLYLSRTANG